MDMTRFAYALILATLLVGCNSKQTDTATNDVTKQTSSTAAPITKLGIEDIKPGTGAAAAKGDYVIVLYLGKLTSGKVFDGNMDENQKPNLDKQPFAVSIGTGGVIKGWDEGLVGSKEGMVRKLNIPWEMAYGAEGKDPIPPKADLVFMIKILKVYKAGVKPSIDAVDVKQGTGPKVTTSSMIKFHYIGSLLNGKIYDDQTKGLEASVSKLIPGFKEAVIGMQSGGERKLSFPPNSPNPTGQIPAGQPFDIDVTIDSVK
jgi:FKBP-type peptidyl-prolyl cis-trans isomerase FkpA